MNWLGDTDQIMVMCAHSYCLGRRTYVVGACTEWLRGIWPQLNANTRHVIVRDTVKALLDDLAGAPIDVDEWARFIRWIVEREGWEFREGVLESLLYRGKESQCRELLGLS